jgi:16S rRNA (guanine1207-N2)-methyltransferase
VAARHLGADSLHRWLQGEGWPTSRLASRGGYRVLEVGAR